MKVGDAVITSENAPLTDGNRMPLGKIPVGFFIHNVEMQPGRGGQIVRSAGSSAKVMANEGKYTTRADAFKRGAKSSVVLLSDHWRTFKSGTQSYQLWKGGRIAMARYQADGARNSDESVDHPHGGGEGCAADRSSVSENAVGKACARQKTRKKIILRINLLFHEE